MAIRDKMRARVQPLLEPDETITTVFGAQTINGMFLLPLIAIALFSGMNTSTSSVQLLASCAALVGLVILFSLTRYRVIAATDRRIVVCESSLWRPASARRLLRSVPRSCTIGAPERLWWRFETLGERLYSHRRFHRDIRAADAARFDDQAAPPVAPPAPPAPPLPPLPPLPPT